MLGGGTKRTGSTAAVLKYDQTGEALQEQEEEKLREDEETVCSVLTPEQIFSQLSMVLHSRGPACAGEERPSDGERERLAIDGSASRETAPSSSSGNGAIRKPTKNKRARERKARKAEQPKRAKTAETKAEKRPRRGQRQSNRCLSAGASLKSRVAVPANDPSPATTPSLSLSRAQLPPPSVHVVEISPAEPSISTTRRRVVSKATPPSVTPGNAAVVRDTPGNAPEEDTQEMEGAESIKLESESPKSDPSAVPKPFTSSAESKPLKNTIALETTRQHCHDNPQHRPPLDYDLLGRLIGEPLLSSFYRSFHAHPHSEHLDVKLLDPLGGGSNFPAPSPPGNLPRWLQITRRRMHVDRNLGPLPLARIILSNSGIVKFQHLFPVIRTVFMYHVKSCDLTTLLSELSPHNILCPGLPGYPANHVALGYHPSGVRVLHTQTPDFRRYDHQDCPLLHLPRVNPKKKSSDNMCPKCSRLNSVVLGLLRNKSLSTATCEESAPLSPTGNGTSSTSGSPTHVTDPRSIPAPDSEEPTPITTYMATPVTMETEGTPNLATYYTESSGQRLISTLTTSPPLHLSS